MLKKLVVKNKVVPVPVPVKDLADAIEWVEQTFLDENNLITKVILDDKDILDVTQDFSTVKLNKESNLEIKIDAPEDLILQSLESIKDFSRAIFKNIKLLAVQCWQLEKKEKIKEFDNIISDLFFIGELSDQMINLLDKEVIDPSAVQAIARLINRVALDLQVARKNENWKECARILLNRLEYLLKDMGNECENVQMDILTAKSKKTLKRVIA